MTANTVHFRVGNGDMHLVEMEGGRKLLIDINVRQPDLTSRTSSPSCETAAAGHLRRLCIDAFL